MKNILWNKIRVFFSSITEEKGLSLIELSIGLIVVGILIIPVFRAHQYEMKKHAYVETSSHIAESLSGLNQYNAGGNVSYPCPASLALGPGDADYGKSDACVLGNIKPCSSAVWFTSGGVCKDNNGGDPIVIGAVPFADLKMSSEHALDYWGNKLIYVVTYSQTNSATYSSNSGKIRVLTVDNPIDVANGAADGIPDPLPDEYEIFVFSTGVTGKGGYTSGGLKLDACGAIAGYDTENCDFDETFFAARNPSDIKASAFSERVGATFFDDMTDMQQYMQVGFWFRNDNTLNFSQTRATRVGIGTSDPEQTLHVEGEIRAQEDVLAGTGGNILSDAICNETQSSCFDPSIITESKSYMNCYPDVTFPLTRGVVRVAQSKVGCSSTKAISGASTVIPGDGLALKVDVTKFGGTNCGALGKVAAGIKSNGEVICKERTN